MRSSNLIMSKAVLYSFCLPLLSALRFTTAAASTGATPGHPIWSNSTKPPLSSSESLRHACHSGVVFLRAIIYQRYERLKQGKANIWDLVQLMAVCSIVQGARLWKRRSAAQNEKGVIRDARSVAPRTASSDRASLSGTPLSLGKQSHWLLMLESKG